MEALERVGWFVALIVTLGVTVYTRYKTQGRADKAAASEVKRAEGEAVRETDRTDTHDALDVMTSIVAGLRNEISVLNQRDYERSIREQDCVRIAAQQTEQIKHLKRELLRVKRQVGRLSIWKCPACDSLNVTSTCRCGKSKVDSVQ